jgi:hypothetical protein
MKIYVDFKNNEVKSFNKNSNNWECCTLDDSGLGNCFESTLDEIRDHLLDRHEDNIEEIIFKNIPKIIQLNTDWDVNRYKACFISEDGIILKGDSIDELTFDCFITHGGAVYETNVLNQFQRVYGIDIELTNQHMNKKGYNNFQDWIFDLEIAVFWNGSNWNLICVADENGYIYSDEED